MNPTLPRVLSYPPRHPYVDRLHDVAATLVDRDAEMPRLEQFYDPAWVRANARRWDVAHLHFGHEQHDQQTVVDVVAAHRDADVPVVVTVHDLQIPHLPGDSTAATDLLRAIAPMACTLQTLTRGCADAVRELTGRTTTAVPHGPLLADHERTRLRARGRLSLGPRHVLVHARRIRPNLGLAELAEACRHSAPALPVRVQVDRAAEAEARELLGGVPHVQLVVHDGMSHHHLASTVAGAHALLLPYRWGTHSGMAELAADVGTPVVHTDVGFLAEQAGDSTGVDPVAVVDHRIDVEDLGRALTQTTNDRIGAWQPVPEHRRQRQARMFTSHHARLYHRLLLAGPDLRGVA